MIFIYIIGHFFYFTGRTQYREKFPDSFLKHATAHCFHLRISHYSAPLLTTEIRQPLHLSGLLNIPLHMYLFTAQ